MKEMSKTIKQIANFPLLILPFLLLLICNGVPYCWSHNAEWKSEMPAIAGIELSSVPLQHQQQPAVMAVSESSDLQKDIEAKLNASSTHAQELLSRKRRYLVFPEGSSFQLVYDEIVGVVDHTNYLILGITVALAWELPSKPPSEILEDLKTRLDDGTLHLNRDDNESNVTYVDNNNSSSHTSTQSPTESQNQYKPNYINWSTASTTSNNGGGTNAYYSMAPVFRTPMNPVYKYADNYYRQPGATVVPGLRRKDSYYYHQYRPNSTSNRNPFDKWVKPLRISSVGGGRYPYWALASRLKDTLRSRTGQRRQSYYPDSNRKTTATTKTTNNSPPPRHHTIYPVFGKRSIPDASNPHPHLRQRRSGVAATHESQLTKLERIQIKHHRNSRQQLYERIGKYLDKRGQHGEECVLRALCETGAKSHETEPGTFVGELMRAVFTLPEAIDGEPVAYYDTRYDKAQANLAGNCAELYSKCKQSMWETDFIK